jgi:SAM-dependent methyltransferase
VSARWKDALLPGAVDGTLPPEYGRRDGVIGRDTLLDASTNVLWSESEFVARSQVPSTTSAVEAEIRRRHVAALAEGFALDRTRPILDLGCADGLLAHTLLGLGFEKLVSTDILYSGVAQLSASLDPSARERTLLVVDDMLALPFPASSFGTVVAWGILSLTEDFDRALDTAWRWLAPGGHLLLAEPLLEQALVYSLVRHDLDEFRRILRDGTRAEMWDKRERRYRVNPARFYARRLADLEGAQVVDSSGVSMLPSLVLGGLVQDAPVADDERAAVAELLAGERIDELGIWRQGHWLVRKA